MSAKIDMLMQRDQRVVSSIEEYGEGAFFFPSQEPQEQQAVVNYVDGQNLEQQAAVNYAGGQNYVQNKGLNQNYPQQSGGHQQQFQPQTYRPNQRQQGYQNQNYGHNRPFGQSLGQNRYQNSNYNQGGFQQKQPFGSFKPNNPTQFHTGESSVPAAKESKLESMLQQLMLNQQKTASEINTKVDNINVKVDTMYHDMNNKWESLSTHEQQAVINYVNGQNLEQQAAVNYVGGQNYVQNKGLNQNYPHQSRGQGQQFQPQAYRPNQGQQGYQNQNYRQNRPFGQSLGQNRYQNSNYNQGGFQQKQPFNSFQPKNPTQFQTGESSVPALLK
ncbi:hypothetical protein DY000_02021233 [Brassica cretica]|uniref:Uncharacterized protein n=1 Tax=Brassica cretica TaxID=69181 RepID=A0ABQ7E4A0_BRACR|nr:hypothetical protein DY000_02021233 [Brassica cretica]